MVSKSHGKTNHLHPHEYQDSIAKPQNWNREALTYFEQVVKLIQLGGTESDFLGHHSNLKGGGDEHLTLQQQCHHTAPSDEWETCNLRVPCGDG